MGRRGDAPLAARLNVGADAWQLVWAYVHRVLVVNLGFVVTNLPLLVALSVVTAPWRYPVFFGVLALGVGPWLAGAFGYLRGAEADDRSSIMDFARSYRRCLARAAGVWAATVGVAGVLVADIVWLHDSATGAVLVPLFAVLLVLAVVTGLTALALAALGPALGPARLVGVAAYAAVRSWWLSLVSLAALVASAVIVNQAPVLGLATVPGCAALLVWVNARSALQPRPPA